MQVVYNGGHTRHANPVALGWALLAALVLGSTLAWVLPMPTPSTMEGER